MKMGMIYERDDLVDVKESDSIKLLSKDINSATELSVVAVPISYNVYIGDDMIYACNCLENAEKIYQIIQADVQGVAWKG